jgi:hypothetical protein
LDAGSALLDASGIMLSVTHSQQKHNWRRRQAGYKPVNFSSPPHEKSVNGSVSGLAINRRLSMALEHFVAE